MRPSDKDLLRQGFERLTPESRFKRFHTEKQSLSPEDLRYLTEVDHRDHEALLALTEAGELVGVARYVRCQAAPDSAEVAVMVTDAWQGRGVASLLVARLERCARDAGVRRLTAMSLHDNAAAVALATRMGFRAVAAAGGKVQLQKRLAVGDPSARGRVRRRVRDGLARTRRRPEDRVRRARERLGQRRRRP